ncbi:MAG: ankyrin repeat domain-containing protein [Actinomycetota bacterium]
METMDDDWIEQFRLHTAAHNGDRAEVQRLLAEAMPVDAFDELNMTPLHYAAKGGHIEIIGLLLAAGADVNAHDAQAIGETPLGAVAANCSYEVAKLLIEAGADPTIPGWMGLTALYRAQQRKRAEGVRVKELLEAAARNPFSARKRRRGMST